MSGPQPRCPICGEVLTGIRRDGPRFIERDPYWSEAGDRPEMVPNPDRRGYAEHEGKPDCKVENVDPLFEAWMEYRQQKLQLDG